MLASIYASSSIGESETVTFGRHVRLVPVTPQPPAMPLLPGAVAIGKAAHHAPGEIR